MAGDQDRSWWSTLPGVLTAVAAFVTAVSGLILALNTAGFLKRDQPVDVRPSVPERTDSGPKPAESKPPAPTPTEAPGNGTDSSPPYEKLEYASYYNAKYGYSVVYPKALLFPDKESAIGRRFKSIDGNVTLSVTSVDNAEHQTPDIAYVEMVQAMAKTPWTVVGKTPEPNGFSLEMRNGSRLKHMKMVMNSSYYRLLDMEYDESERAMMDGVWSHVAKAFEQ
jgi:hypothetical protein